MSRHWPFHAMRFTADDLELRLPDEALLDDLLDLACQGIHDANVMPFLVPWTDTPPSEFAARFLQYHWRCQAKLSPESWALNFVVSRDGVVVGTQGIEAVEYTTRRAVETGSWFGRAFQRQGVGLRMRRAVLSLAFDHLGANVAHSGAIEGNAGSLAITQRIGYEPNGWRTVAPRGQPVREEEFVLTRERWSDLGARTPIEVEGLEPCKPLLGI